MNLLYLPAQGLHLYARYVCRQFIPEFLLKVLALILGIAYTFSQDNKNKKVSFFVISFRAIWLPWAILGLTFVLGGPDAAMKQGTGLLAAHLYDFLTRLWPTFGGGKNYIKTPAVVKRWFGADRRGLWDGLQACESSLEPRDVQRFQFLKFVGKQGSRAEIRRKLMANNV
ncbi:MAG: hypothetical protein Q9164_000423 [Protoblastenia rupestris]